MISIILISSVYMMCTSHVYHDGHGERERQNFHLCSFLGGSRHNPYKTIGKHVTTFAFTDLDKPRILGGTEILDWKCQSKHPEILTLSVRNLMRNQNCFGELQCHGKSLSVGTRVLCSPIADGPLSSYTWQLCCSPCPSLNHVRAFPPCSWLMSPIDWLAPMLQVILISSKIQQTQ